MLILAVWGCQSTPTPSGSQAAARDAAAQTPETLLELALVAPPARASRLYLQAAEAYLAAGDTDAAADALRFVDPDRLNDAAAARYLLARGRLDLAAGQLESARAALLALDETLLADPLEALLLRAEVTAAEQGAGAAADMLMEHDLRRPGPASAGEPPARQRLNDAIWRYLGQVPPLQALERPSRARGDAQGWWQLKAEMFQSFTLAEQRRRLAAWRSAWPDHPAATMPPAPLLGLDEPRAPVARVGLMLPLSGPLSRAGRAVRDAFIATYLTHRDDAGFEIIVYDVDAQPLGALYEHALVNGVDVLIGPLSKEGVAEMNGLDPDIPVLALNHLGSDEMPAPNVVQLGLAIEDEAATLERWLADEGVDRLVLFHNDEDWSLRAMQAMAASWPGALEIQSLENIRTVTESVGVAMHVAASQERRAELEKILGQNVEFLARARGDVDAVLALVTHLEANALVPALRFHFADHLPVYATSQTIRGVPRPRLRDLSGFRVSELPWPLLNDGSYAMLDEAFALEGDPFLALYALGVDAFRLADRLPLMLGGTFTEILGSTGALTFSADGRIRRSLARTVIRGTEVQPATGSYGR